MNPKFVKTGTEFEMELTGHYAFELSKFSWSERGGSKAHSLENVNFLIPKGACTTIVGASGAGKSTLLTLLVEKFRLNPSVISSPSPTVVLHHQDSRLMPWLTIRENLLLEKHSREHWEFELVCDRLGLTSILARFPHQVSGGQRERAALGRSLLGKPDIFLLDEPLASTDHFLRLQVEDFFGEIVEKTGRTIVVVTHDLTEAIAISDRIIYLFGDNGVFTSGVVDVPENVRKAQPSKVRQLRDFPKLMADLTNALSGS